MSDSVEYVGKRGLCVLQEVEVVVPDARPIVCGAAAVLFSLFGHLKEQNPFTDLKTR